jgi:arylsulfatase A-like enzyme
MNSLRSLVLITVDCLRADHVGFLGYDRKTTPFLDSLASESRVLPNAIVAGAPTYYSFPAIMASRYPLALGRDVIGLAPEEATLATVMKQLGYSTAAFLAANPYLSPRFGYDTGFDTFHDFLDEESADIPLNGGGTGMRGRLNRNLADLFHKLGSAGSVYDELYFQYCQRLTDSPGVSLDRLRRFPAADVIVDHASDWLGGIAGGPFFLWLHFMDPHSPYYPSKKSLQWMGHPTLDARRARYVNSYWNRSDLTAKRLARHRDEVIALYDAGIRWVDGQIARLVDILHNFNLWENTVMALTADHGEEFLDHGGRYHSPSKVTEELIHVPLLIRVPGLKNMEPARSTFSLIRLAPTLLEAVGARPPDSFRGSSLWATLQHNKDWEGQAIVECVSGCNNPFLASNRLGPRILAIREDRYKLVVDFGSSSEQLFDLNLDVEELHPLPPSKEKSVRYRLLQRARQHLADSLLPRDPSHRVTAQLRDLQIEWANSSVRIPT